MRASFAWAAFIGWAIFLYWGVTTTTASASLCATIRELPQNHLITAGDLKCASSSAATFYSGLYLRRTVGKETHVPFEDISDAPVLRLSPDYTLFTLNLHNRPDLKKLDADQKLDLGTGSTVIARQSRVLAILCSSRGSDECTMTFEVSQSAIKQLVLAEQAQIGIVDSTKAEPQQTDAAKSQHEKVQTVKKPDGKPASEKTANKK